jgi:hypothetical protein
MCIYVHIDISRISSESGKVHMYIYILTFPGFQVNPKMAPDICIYMYLLTFSGFQVNPEKYSSLSHGFRLLYREGGAKNLLLGWAPTFMGYAAQG